MRVAEGVEMLEIQGGFGQVNPVLAWDENGAVLMDAGFPGQEELFIAAMAAVGVTPEDVRAIMLTHQDMDHIGSMRALKAMCPNAAIIAHTDEAKYIDGTETPIKMAKREQEDSNGFTPEQREHFAKMKRALADIVTPVDRVISDGDVLEWAGGIEAIHTPGHTPGHICLFLRKTGVLVAGDSMNARDGVLSGPAPEHSFDLAQARASLKKLDALPIQKVVCYHGGFVEGKPDLGKLW